MSEYEVIDISSENQFEELAQSNLPVLVDFWAPWCKPCQAMMPIISNVAKQYAESLQVVKVNIDTLPDIASRYNIRSIPHCILFQGGAQLGAVTGVQLPEQLKAFLKQYLPALKD